MGERKLSSKSVEQDCKARGLLAMSLYVVETVPTGSWEAIFEHVEAHLEHQRKLEARGTLLAAGPLMTDDGEYYEGEGLFVIRAASLAEAQQVAASDPMHVSGVRRFRVRPWLLNEGRLSFNLNLSTATLELL